MRWSAQIHTAFHVCRITQGHPRVSLDFGYGGITLSAGTFQFLHLSIEVPRRGPTTPGTSPRFGLFRFRSPLLGESRLISFPEGTEMFHFPSFARHNYEFIMSYQLYWWVSPFGNLRIKVCVPLPEAYRSLPRPSSPLSAKASTISP